MQNTRIRYLSRETELRFKVLAYEMKKSDGTVEWGEDTSY
jgi:hypothetical protein